MLTQTLHVSLLDPEPEKIRTAAEAIRQGELVVFPTETVYGIAANALNEKALEKLNALKQRPKGKHYSWHVSDAGQMLEHLESPPGWLGDFLQSFWPGPLTVVLQTKEGGTCGFRMPDHPVAIALIRESKVPVVAPSANVSGELPPTSAGAALKNCDGKVAVVLDAGETTVGKESTVVDITKLPPKVLREGAIPKDQILGWFENNL